MRSSEVQIVSPAEFDPGTAQTPGSERRVIHVPAFLPHMEISPSKLEPFRWVVARSTATPIVVNLPDDTWP
jgi:hypothetical protein